MKTTAKFLALAMIGMLISCSNNASLQKYFVEKLDDCEFVTVDFARVLCLTMLRDCLKKIKKF